MLKINWTEHVENDEVFGKIEENSFLKIVKIRRTKLIGHIIRYNSLLNRILKCAIENRNSREIPSLGFISQVIKDTDFGSYCELKRKVNKREERAIAANQPLGFYQKQKMDNHSFTTRNNM